VACCEGAHGQRDSVFAIDGRNATWAMVTVGIDRRTLDGDASAMLATLEGVLASYSGKDVGRLRAIQGEGADAAAVARDAPRVCTVHLGRGDLSARVDVFRIDDGRYVAGRIVDGRIRGKLARLDSERFATLAQGWDWRAARPTPGDIEPGRVEQMPKPYRIGRFVLDDETVSRRMFGGGRSRIKATERVLANETIFIRIPERTGPAGRYGVLVWLDPTPGGRPPGVFFEVCDELGLICVGAQNAGNGRPAVERLQLAFDALATVEARYPIDDDRVYAAGMSGGGRLSSMLWGTFPDVFAGAVPIVGCNCYKQISRGDGKAWPAAFRRPKGEMLRRLKSNRIAPMSGPSDFNYEQTKVYVEEFSKDGMDVRFFEHADMAHVMPTPERFAEAMRWVDQPWRKRRQEDTERGRAMLAAYIAEFGERGAASAEERARLVAITIEAPWTSSAYLAAALLGYAAPAVDD